MFYEGNCLMGERRSFFKKSDIITIIIILITAFVLALSFFLIKSRENVTAKIYVNDSLYKTIDLKSVRATEIIEINAELKVSIEISPNGIRFLQSECPDKICINSGLLSQPHQSAACLPARVAITVE